MLFHDSHDLLPGPGGIQAEEPRLRFCDESDAVTLRTWDGQESRLPRGVGHLRPPSPFLSSPCCFYDLSPTRGALLRQRPDQLG